MAKFPCYFQELQWKKRKLFPHNSKVSLFFSGTVKKKRKLCPHYRKVFWLFSGQLPPSTVMKKRKLFHIKCRLLSDPKKFIPAEVRRPESDFIYNNSICIFEYSIDFKDIFITNIWTVRMKLNNRNF